MAEVAQENPNFLTEEVPEKVESPRELIKLDEPEEKDLY